MAGFHLLFEGPSKSGGGGRNNLISRSMDFGRVSSGSDSADDGRGF